MEHSLARARERALRFLEHRDRTRREVEVRLLRYGYEPQTVDEVIAWLEELGYLNDARYAAAFAAEKRRAGWGPLRIRQSLSRRGVHPDLVREVTEDRGFPEALVETVRRRFVQAALADPAAARRRAVSFLARRGHDSDTIAAIVGAALGSGAETREDAGES